VTESDRAERQRAIAEYAAAMAGTRFDLDVDLEAAGIEELMSAIPETP
jgi:hypothetical protein